MTCQTLALWYIRCSQSTSFRRWSVSSLTLPLRLLGGLARSAYDLYDAYTTYMTYPSYPSYVTYQETD